jgi:acyl-coenzyme A synthetase/AMP-(fatty) acid ligase
MLAMMIQEDYIKKADLSCLRQIRSASSHFSQKMSNSVKEYFPNAHVLNSYGITEVGPSLFGPHPDMIPRPITSVGYPAEGIEYRLVDNILQIKSPSMMTSYHKKSINESFTDDGFFITRDRFRIDDAGLFKTNFLTDLKYRAIVAMPPPSKPMMVSSNKMIDV